VARMGESKGVYRLLVGKPEGRRLLGSPRRRCRITLRWDVGIWTGPSWPRMGRGGGRL